MLVFSNSQEMPLNLKQALNLVLLVDYERRSAYKERFLVL